MKGKQLKNLKISSFYGKEVISSAGRRGYVISVNELDGRIERLICADENEREFQIDVNDILKTGESIIFKDGECGAKNTRPVRLGVPAFDSEGNYLGTLNDFTVVNNALGFAHIGKKRYPVSDIVYGDAVIVKRRTRILKSDVVKDGRVILKRGEPLTPENLQRAQNEGEYIQTNLKSI